MSGHLKRVLGARCWVLGAVLGAGCGVLGAAATASAQTREPGRPGRFDVGIGLRWTGGSSLAPVGAAETTPGGTPFSLFTSQTRFESAPGIEGRLGVRVARRLHVEATASYARPDLTTKVTNDVEAAPSTSITESLVQLKIEGGVLVPLRRPRIGARVEPFLTAGGGYLRELHEGQTIVATGQSYYAGGGLNYALKVRPARRFDTIGLRLDARAAVRHGGISLDGATHVAPLFAASLFVRF
jgi:hypothetical protein